MIPVKICGITNLDDAMTCIRQGVSAIGFIFAESKRKVTVEAARRISLQIPPFITKVGVFVEEDPSVIKEILTDCRLDLAQIHGDGTARAAFEILPGRVIKAFKAGLDEPDPHWKEAPLRAVLVDSYVPGQAGGTGKTFDWALFDKFRRLGFPLILAGGLNPGNIKDAILTARPDAVDLSSGVEHEPGYKDVEKVKKLMEEIRSLKGEE